MANETAVHRVDAALASGPVTPIDADLAVDGIDELLGFLAGPWWEDEPSDDGAGHRVRITAGTRSWLVAMERTSVTVEQASSEPGDAEVSGAPHDTVLWLWGRAGDEAVRQDGDPQAVSGFRRRLAAETQ